MDTGMQREYTPPRSDPNSQLVCAVKGNVRIGPVLDSKTPNLPGKSSLEVVMPSKHHVLGTHASQTLDLEHFLA